MLSIFRNLYLRILPYNPSREDYVRMDVAGIDFINTLKHDKNTKNTHAIKFSPQFLFDLTIISAFRSIWCEQISSFQSI